MAITQLKTGAIADDAVTTDKLANAINTERTANTAKSTNATHTGDVTGSGSLTIADNAVTLAKMAGGTDGQIITYDASGDPVAVGPGTDGQVLTSTGAGSPPAFEALPAGGIEHIYQWNAGGYTLDGDAYVTANWQDANANNWSGYPALGSGMSESSGVFTFPATGYWLIMWRNFMYVQNTANRWTQLRIDVTTDNSNYNQRTVSSCNQYNASGTGNGVIYDSAATELIFDVTNVSTHKVKFHVSTDASVNISGSAYGSDVRFIKLAGT
tara:strand:- start:251 stop:1057 length:807 start_codon:yes stop_codon:yes gene_type:complete